MKRVTATRWVSLLITLVSVAACGAFDSNHDTLALLKSARAQVTSVKARYLDPLAAPPGIRPLDEQVVACEVWIREVTDVEALFDALLKGIENDPSEVPECWEPRHALIVPGESELKVTICFVCAQGVIRKDGSLTGFTLSPEGEAVFDRVFQRHGLRKPKKKEPNSSRNEKA